MSSFIAAGTRPFQPRHQHDPVLHLLLDVRLPADRRPDLGRRRHARPRASCWAAPPAAPRWPAKACSTRTATATCSPWPIPTVPGLRPGLRLRNGGHRAGRHAPHVLRGGGRLLLHHADERELRDADHADGLRQRAFCRGMYRGRPQRDRGRRARTCSCSAAGPSSARRCGAGDPGRASTAFPARSAA